LLERRFWASPCRDARNPLEYPLIFPSVCFACRRSYLLIAVAVAAVVSEPVGGEWWWWQW